MVGTIAYMAPEQASREPLTPACDWYAVGSILYEAMVGRPPFVGSVSEILHAKREGEIVPPGRLRVGLPPDLESLCVDLLHRDPLCRPAGSDILRRLGVAATSAVPAGLAVRPVDEPIPFVGRKAEWKRLHDAFDMVRDGLPAIVLVGGPSGAGKTTLIRRFLDDVVLREGGVALLQGRCREQESVPYKAVDSLVDDLGRLLNRWPDTDDSVLLPKGIDALVRIFPVLGRVEHVRLARRTGVEIIDPQELRRHAFAALRELLTRIGERRTLVAWIDDLHWGDLDGAVLLSSLLEGDDPPRLLLIASYRSEYTSSSLCRRSLRDQFDGAAGLPVRAGDRTVDRDRVLHAGQVPPAGDRCRYGRADHPAGQWQCLSPRGACPESQLAERRR